MNLKSVGLGISGASSSAQFTIRNGSKTGTLIGTVSIVNNQSGNAFALTTPGSFTISPHGAPMTETMTYVPGSLSDSATITIASNDPMRGSIDIPVSGKGLPGKLSSPKTLKIVAISAGTAFRNSITPGSASLTLRNTGKGILLFAVSAANGAFDGGNVTGSIAPGASSAPIVITFAPTELAPTVQTERLQITSNSPGTASVTTNVTLRGILKKSN
ncbi:MAG TPA: hypothetical protein VMT64_08370 [Candidatus Binataceae bacterium]|nr:hypothetical protein [Candidatus Binataceae bacterium]